MKKPLISIITVLYNNLEGLKQTLPNILAQDFKDYEIVVIDGASKDGTADFLKQNNDKIAYWESTQDKGLYDAMNKAVSHANGEWVLFLNGGDLLYAENTLSKVAQHLTEDVDLVYGANIHASKEEGSRVRHHREISHLWKGMQFSHQSMYVRTSVCKEHPYDISLKLAADYDLVMYAKNSGKKFKMLNFPVSTTEAGGRSDQKRMLMFSEQLQVLHRYEHNLIHDFLLYSRMTLERIKILLHKG